MSEHIAGVDMLGQAEVIELKSKVREYEKELMVKERQIETQEQELKRLKGIAGKSYAMGAIWFTAIGSFIVGVGITAGYFLLA